MTEELFDQITNMVLENNEYAITSYSREYGASDYPHYKAQVPFIKFLKELETTLFDWRQAKMRGR